MQQLEVRSLPNGKRYWVNPDTDDVVKEYIEPAAPALLKGSMDKVGKEVVETFQEAKAGPAIADYLTESLPALGSTIGFGLGNAPGLLAGSMIGTGTKDLIKKMQGTLGENEVMNNGLLKETVTNLGMDALGFGVGKVASGVLKLGKNTGSVLGGTLKDKVLGNGPGFKERLAEKFRPMAERYAARNTRMSPDAKEFVTSNIDFPGRVDDLTGVGSAADTITNLMQPQMVQKLNQERNDYFLKQFDTLRDKNSPLRVNFNGTKKATVDPSVKTNSSAENADVIQANLKEGYKKTKGVADTLWSRTKAMAGFHEGVETVTKTTPGGVSSILDEYGKPTKLADIVEKTKHAISGPINISRSKRIATTILNQVKATYNNPSSEKLYAMFDPEGKKFLAQLEGMVSGKGKVSFGAALDFKREMGEKGYKNLIASGWDEGLAKKLNGTMKDEIRASIKAWDSELSEQTLKNFDRANAVSQKIGENFKDIRELTSAMKNPLSGISDLKALLGDHVAAAKAIKSSSNKQETRRALASEYLGSMRDRMTQGGSNITDLKVLDELGSRNPEMFNLLIPPADRVVAKKLFGVIKELTEKPTMQGQNYLTFKEGQAGISLVGDFVQTLVGNKQPIAAVTGFGAKGGAIILGGKLFTERIALNPQVARNAIALSKLPPESPKAITLAKTVWGALRGVQVKVQTEGREYPAVINDNGKLEEVKPTEPKEPKGPTLPWLDLEPPPY